MPRDAEEHEAWAAAVAQALYEAAENAATGHFPEYEVGWGEGDDGGDITGFTVLVKGAPPE